MEINMNSDSLRVFQKYMELKQNLIFDSFIPTLDFNEKSFVEKVITNFGGLVQTDVKFKPPTENFATLAAIEKEKEALLEKEREIRERKREMIIFICLNHCYLNKR